MLRVLVLGYGPMGLALVRGMLACSDMASLVGVIPWSYLPGERLNRQEESEYLFCTFLKSHNLPVIQVPGVNHYRFTEVLHTLKPHLVVVGSWGEIVKPHVLQTPDVLFVNCHPSLLPMHRGPNPYTSAILAGAEVTGVTFHEMDTRIDTGPILMQQSLPISPYETGESLRERCAELAKTMVPDLLKQFSEGTLAKTPQTGVGSYERVSAELGWIPWHEPPEVIERRIRGLYPWFDNLAQVGRHTVAFPFGRLVEVAEKQESSAAAQPGVIYKVDRNGMWVTTCAPRQGLLLEHPRLLDYPLLTPLVCPFLLKPGRQLTSPSSGGSV